MTRGLSIEFQAILDGDVYQPGSGGIDEATGETMEAQQEGVGTARPMPDTEMEVGDQPEEEAADSSDPNHDLRTAAKERAVNSLENLADGTFEIDNRVLTLCVCGDPRHTMAECEYDQDTKAAVVHGIEIMRAALLCYPRHQRARGASTS